MSVLDNMTKTLGVKDSLISRKKGRDNNDSTVFEDFDNKKFEVQMLRYKCFPLLSTKIRQVWGGKSSRMSIALFRRKIIALAIKAPGMNQACSFSVTLSKCSSKQDVLSSPKDLLEAETQS